MKNFYEKHKWDFLIAVISIFLVHFTKMTHYLPNWDNMYAVSMHPEGMTALGRWLSGVATAIFTSSYDLQWVSGIVSTLFLASTMCLLIDLFDIKNKILSVIATVVLVTFPSITGAFMYIQWTASYMCALFMAVLAVYLVVKNNSKWNMVICPLLICLSLAIYQIYVLFAIACVVCYFAIELMTSENKLKDYKNKIFNFIGTIIVGFIVYYLINTIVLWCLDISVSNQDYQGVGSVAFLGIKGLYKAALKTIEYFVKFIIGGSAFSVYSLINLLTMAGFVALTVWALIKKCNRNIYFKLSIVALFIAVIPITYFYLFLSKGIKYHSIMTIGLYFIYLSFIVLLDKYHINLKNYLYKTAAVVLSLVCFYNFINTNIAYKQLEMSYERTYFEVCEVVQFIDQINENGYKEVYVIGEFPREEKADAVKANPAIIGASTANFVTSEYHFVTFANNYLGRDYKSCSQEQKDDILKDLQFEELEAYPSKNCVKVINEVIVVKLS